MTMDRLVSYSLVSLACFGLILPETHAEYYNVISAPVIHHVDAGPCYVKPRPCYTKKRHRRVHRHHYRPRCYEPRCCDPHCPDISVNYYWNSFPAPCSCENYSPCSNCGASPLHISRYDMDYSCGLEGDCWGIDFDRRTADDIGNDLNIDY